MTAEKAVGLVVYVVVAIAVGSAVAYIWSSRWMVLALPVAIGVAYLARAIYQRRRRRHTAP